MKKHYKVPVEWTVFDFVDVEADSFTEAVRYVLEHKDEIPLGKEPEYVDGSFQVNGENDVFFNHEEQFVEKLTELLESFGYGDN